MRGSAERRPEADNSARRRFLNLFPKGIAAAWLASVVYPVLRFLSPKKEIEAALSSVEVGLVGEERPNSGGIIRFGSEPVVLIRRPDGSLAAFSAVCTHLSCIVQYRPDAKRIWCACHNGWYDLNGINVAGPPPRPLTPYGVRVMGEKVYVTRAT